MKHEIHDQKHLQLQYLYELWKKIYDLIMDLERNDDRYHLMVVKHQLMHIELLQEASKKMNRLLLFCEKKKKKIRLKKFWFVYTFFNFLILFIL